MQVVIFVSNDNLSDLLLSKLRLLFTSFKLVNIDDTVNVFDLENKFSKNKTYFLDLCNCVKSKELLAFLSSTLTSTCYDLKYLFRSYFHFKYEGKFFDLLKLNSLRKITSHEIKIYNRSVDHTIEFLKGFPILFKSYDKNIQSKIALNRQSFDDLFRYFLDSDHGFVLTQNNDNQDFLECVFKDKKLVCVYTENHLVSDAILNKSIKSNLNIISSHLPMGILTFRLVKTDEDYYFSEFNFGLKPKFIELSEVSDIAKLINLELL
ncbi:hypothetical protein CL656_02255 [bacterium]|nr:hypothetical protein [bacterium]|tara:strand:+ start:765 stop:1556 length:792 start_codon:yes stop_codon:yes gene_type:complete